MPLMEFISLLHYPSRIPQAPTIEFTFSKLVNSDKSVSTRIGYGELYSEKKDWLVSFRMMESSTSFNCATNFVVTSIMRSTCKSKK